MNVVVDSSFLIAALVDGGERGIWAESVLADASLFAPELVLVEVSNVLRRLERAGTIATPAADAAFGDLMRLAVELLPYEPFAARIWQLRRGLTCYDAWYVAIAEALDAPLATLDEALTRATGPRCEFIVPRARSGR